MKMRWALNELGDVIGEDRIHLNCFVKTMAGYNNTVDTCTRKHRILNRFFGTRRSDYRHIIFIKTGPQGKASVVKQMGSTFHVDDRLQICQDIHKTFGRYLPGDMRRWSWTGQRPLSHCGAGFQYDHETGPDYYCIKREIH